MRKGIFIFIGVISFFFFSCETEITSDGNITSETYSLSTNPTKISVEHDIDVKVKYSLAKKVHVTGSENLLDYVKISASGGVLRIGMKPDYTYVNMDVSAIIEIPAFTELAIIHDGNIEVDSFANSITNLNMIISGTGNITALHYLQITNFYSHLSGSGSVTMNGYSSNQNINISGTGNFSGFDLLSNNSTVNISGVGNVEVNPKLLLNANIDGSGNIYYKRYPEIVSTITGSGVIIDSN